ncbi:MAG: hypothetical protein O7C59_11910 [Rickettsia endosymbiont of Ixodes persulcatus]|nr:hypothetical protein [Rickettsia endosymbiont of Ixodes persulcatus]
MARSKYSKDLYKSFLQASSVRYSGKAFIELQKRSRELFLSITGRLNDLKQFLKKLIKLYTFLEKDKISDKTHQMLIYVKVPYTRRRRKLNLLQLIYQILT